MYSYNAAFLHLWMQPLVLRDEELILLPEKVVWWPSKRTVIVADLHWGKTAHFRKNGIAIPAETQKQDEKRLADLIARHSAERLIIAGDLFHSKANNETDSFNHWRYNHRSLHIDLVSGNHDILPNERYKELNINLNPDTLLVVPFIISHDALSGPDHFNIHGHVHPAVRINGMGKQSVKLPCFAVAKNNMILPAFGQFTGTHTLEANSFDALYVITEHKTLQWK
jgi:DNA ligase-associated metallophosphoesterase